MSLCYVWPTSTSACSPVPERALGSTREDTLDKLTLTNPVFATYAVAATLMILKTTSMSWLTVGRM
ncbi:MAG: hypothetical protein ABI627_15540, partial [Polyangiaceae bacterium]